ncbi:MAG: hypothetical protein LBD23_01595 [Oscillospiraceae bacterium]|jgi:hypothetical protein|nr:hypothetical protein [Oscillospiraceae bacterium]
MRFLIAQIIIVILVCIFVAALSNLTELGLVGWILAGSTGHALFKIFKLMNNGLKSKDANKSRASRNHIINDLSERLQSFMFDDATEVRDD